MDSKMGRASASRSLRVEPKPLVDPCDRLVRERAERADLRSSETNHADTIACRHDLTRQQTERSSNVAVGECAASPPRSGSRLTAHVVIGVLAAASGRGIGSGLLSEVESWTRAHGLHRLELTVMAHNRRAGQLYQHMGFAVEGRRRECLLVDGNLADELYLAKLLR